MRISDQYEVINQSINQSKRAPNACEWNVVYRCSQAQECCIQSPSGVECGRVIIYDRYFFWTLVFLSLTCIYYVPSKVRLRGCSRRSVFHTPLATNVHVVDNSAIQFLIQHRQRQTYSDNEYLTRQDSCCRSAPSILSEDYRTEISETSYIDYRSDPFHPWYPFNQLGRKGLRMSIIHERLLPARLRVLGTKAQILFDHWASSASTMHMATKLKQEFKFDMIDAQHE